MLLKSPLLVPKQLLLPLQMGLGLLQLHLQYVLGDKWLVYGNELTLVFAEIIIGSDYLLQHLLQATLHAIRVEAGVVIDHVASDGVVAGYESPDGYVNLQLRDVDCVHSLLGLVKVGLDL